METLNQAKIIEKLRQIFSEDKSIIFACLFGSYATGTQNKFSDIDIAVYLEGVEDIFEKKLELITKIMKELKFNDIDLVILNKVSPFVVSTVVSSGKLIFSRDERKRIEFITKKIKLNMEMAYYRKLHRDAMIKRIMEGRFGK